MRGFSEMASSSVDQFYLDTHTIIKVRIELSSFYAYYAMLYSQLSELTLSLILNIWKSLRKRFYETQLLPIFKSYLV